MCSKTIFFCVAMSEQQAERIALALKVMGFAGSDISVLLPDNKTHAQDFAERTATGGLGGGLRWLVRSGALAIPGVGLLIGAGPIMAALAGAAVVGVTGGTTGALVRLGIPPHQAKQYENKIRKGRMLISVRADDGAEVGEAREIFAREGAQDIFARRRTPMLAGKFCRRSGAEVTTSEPSLLEE